MKSKELLEAILAFMHATHQQAVLAQTTTELVLVAAGQVYRASIDATKPDAIELAYSDLVAAIVLEYMPLSVLRRLNDGRLFHCLYEADLKEEAGAKAESA